MCFSDAKAAPQRLTRGMKPEEAFKRQGRYFTLQKEILQDFPSARRGENGEFANPGASGRPLHLYRSPSFWFCEATAPPASTTLLVLLPPPRCCFPCWRGEELSTAHGQGDAAEQLCPLYLPFQVSSTAPQPHTKSQHAEQLRLPPKLTFLKHSSVNYKRSPTAGRLLVRSGRVLCKSEQQVGFFFFISELLENTHQQGFGNYCPKHNQGKTLARPPHNPRGHTRP